MFSQYAFLWAVGFLAIYVVAQLAVSRLPMFESYSAIKKSVTVKVIALIVFVLAYAIVKVFI